MNEQNPFHQPDAERAWDNVSDEAKEFGHEVTEEVGDAADQLRDGTDDAATEAKHAAEDATHDVDGEKNPDRLQAKAENLADSAAKLAADAGYAVTGFATFVSEKAKSLYEEQRQQYVASHPEAENAPGAKQFLDQLSSHLSKFVDELTKGYRDMTERGRNAAGVRTEQPATDVTPTTTDATSEVMVDVTDAERGTGS